MFTLKQFERKQYFSAKFYALELDEKIVDEIKPSLDRYFDQFLSQK